MAREYRDNAYRIVIMRRNITGIDSMNLGYSDSEMCGRVLAWRSLFASMGYGLPKPVKVFQRQARNLHFISPRTAYVLDLSPSVHLLIT